MAEEIIIEGKTFEAAMEEAQTKYTGENVQYEILEMPKRGIFGIGATPAKIKVIINDNSDDDDADLSSIVASIKGLGVTTNRGGGDADEAVAKKAAPSQPAAKKQEKKQHAKTAKSANPAPAKEENAQKPRKTEKNAAEKPVAVKENEKSEIETTAIAKNNFEAKEPRVIEVTDAEKECALNFANTLLQDMGVDAVAKFSGNEPSGIGGNTYPHIEIVGEGAGILIGHHGETLDAIQYLVNLCAHRKGGSSSKEFVKIIVDIEDYRRKREETLRSLARRTASKAVKYKRNMVLEPMNPFERRIIHSEIQDIENVSTHSVGSDENRKIVVCYDGPDKVDRRRRGNARHSESTVKTAAETEASDETVNGEN